MIKNKELNDGNQIPELGLGTWESKNGDEAKNAVLSALRQGYRHIDTAMIYGNEESVGQAIKESGIPREEIFVTTKLWNDDHDNPEEAIKKSLEKLQLEYIDLYLIHWPVPKRLESWEQMKKFKEQGICKSIGVCNFTIKHLDEMIEKSDTIPVINQVEFSPFNYQKELSEFCKEKNIQIEAYSPLTRGDKLENPIVKKIADAHGKSPAQIMIRWSLQHGLIPIPKSVNENRIKENMEVFDFELTQEEIVELNNLNEGFRRCPNPEEMS